MFWGRDVKKTVSFRGPKSRADSVRLVLFLFVLNGIDDSRTGNQEVSRKEHPKNFFPKSRRLAQRLNRWFRRHQIPKIGTTYQRSSGRTSEQQRQKTKRHTWPIVTSVAVGHLYKKCYNRTSRWFTEVSKSVKPLSMDLR